MNITIFCTIGTITTMILLHICKQLIAVLRVTDIDEILLTCEPTFSSHAHLEALLETTVLALVAMVLIDGTSPVTAARVRQVTTHGALEEALATFTRKLTVMFARALVVTNRTLDDLTFRGWCLRRNVVVVIVVVAAGAAVADATAAAVGVVKLMRRRGSQREGVSRSRLRGDRRLN